jgi:hypothetical protein
MGSMRAIPKGFLQSAEDRVSFEIMKIQGIVGSAKPTLSPETCSRSESNKLRVKISQAFDSKHKLRIRHHWELLDAIPNEQGEFELNISSLGSGPIRLQLVALDEKSNVLYSGPPTVTVVK